MSAAATRSYKVSMFMNVEKQSFIIEIQLYRINKLSFFFHLTIILEEISKNMVVPNIHVKTCAQLKVV